MNIGRLTDSEIIFLLNSNFDGSIKSSFKVACSLIGISIE